MADFFSAARNDSSELNVSFLEWPTSWDLPIGETAPSNEKTAFLKNLTRHMIGESPGADTALLDNVLTDAIPRVYKRCAIRYSNPIPTFNDLREELANWREILAGTCGRLHVTRQGDKMRARTHSKSSRDKVRAHRKRLRQQGLRPIQIWVPDMRSPAFVTEAHRQSLAVANSPHAKEDQDFIDAVSDWGAV